MCSCIYPVGVCSVPGTGRAACLLCQRLRPFGGVQEAHPSLNFPPDFQSRAIWTGVGDCLRGWRTELGCTVASAVRHRTVVSGLIVYLFSEGLYCLFGPPGWGSDDGIVLHTSFSFSDAVCFSLSAS